MHKQGTNTGLAQLFDTEAFNCGFGVSNFKVEVIKVCKATESASKREWGDTVIGSYYWSKRSVSVLLMSSIQCKAWSCLLHLVNLMMTHWPVFKRKEAEWRKLYADWCDLCTTQTLLSLIHRESSMLLCLTRDTTFSCRWATYSHPSCSWHSLSSSSSSSLAEVEPKVKPQSNHLSFALTFWVSCNFLVFFRVLSSGIHEVSAPKTHVTVTDM